MNDNLRELLFISKCHTSKALLNIQIVLESLDRLSTRHSYKSANLPGINRLDEISSELVSMETSLTNMVKDLSNFHARIMED